MAAVLRNREMEFLRLKHFAKAAADEIRGLIVQCDIEEYKTFLDAMYHFTFAGEWNLLMATVRSKPVELQEYFFNHANEMRGHYLLVQSDMEEFGCAVSEEASGAVRAYWDYWRSVPATNAAQYIGAVYVFENIAAFLRNELRAMIGRLNLTTRQSSWLIKHLGAGKGRDALIEEIAWRYFSRFQDDILEGAETFYKHWVSIFKNALIKRTHSHFPEKELAR